MTGTLTPQQRLWRWRVLISTYVGYMGYYLTRKVFTICKKPIADDFGWELSSVSHIWTAFLLAYMVGQFIASYFGRKGGPRMILLGGLGLSIACNVVFGLANSYATLLVFMIINGLVQATGWPGVVGSVAQWLRNEERGQIMGVWSTSYQLGTLLIKFYGAYLLGTYGWRWSFAGCTLATIAVWWLLYFWQRNRPEDAGLPPIIAPHSGSGDNQQVQVANSDQITLRQYLRIAFSPIVLMMGIGYLCTKFLRYALESWLPAFLTIQGLDPARASYYSTTFDLAGLAGVVITGYLLDRVFRGNWAALSFFMALGMIGGYGAVIYFGSSPLAISVCFGVVGMMLFGPESLLNGAAAVEVAGEKNGIAVVGIVNGIASFGPIIQEEVISALMHGDPHIGIRNTNRLYLAMSILFACFMLVAWWRLHRTRVARSAGTG